MKIIAVGCSYTYGQGLLDCHIEPNLPGPVHSKQSWPSLLGSLLEKEVVNLSQPGYSNLAILNEILNYDLEINDIVCIMWTFKNRDMKFRLDKNNIKHGRWDKKWAFFQDPYDLMMKNFIHIHHAKCYLEGLGIKYFFMDLDNFNVFRSRQDGQLFSLPENQLPSWITTLHILDIDFSELEKNTPLGLDNLHPGPIFHQIIAEILQYKIQNLNFSQLS